VSASQELYRDAIAVGGELGTSTTKFCADDQVVIFSSVVGDALTSSLEDNWRRMNRSRDRRWIRNLALWDDKREGWRYVGAMTRSSEKPNWFTERGLVQNMDDAFLGLAAGIFLLSKERQAKGLPSFQKIGMCFGVPVKAGENAAEEFFKYLKSRLVKDGESTYLPIKAKNVATGEVEELKVRMSFLTIQFQGYGAYMTLVFGKYNMKTENTYVVDIGHGTWIKLPVIDNEVDMRLADSTPQGMHTITENISRVIFEKSRQRFRIPEQRIMEKLPRGETKVEVPGEGVFDFKPVLDAEANSLADSIVTRVVADVQALGHRAQAVKYIAIVGGGAPLVFTRLKAGIAKFFGWSDEEATRRIIDLASLGAHPRTINSIGFMLLAKDQIALELGEPVDPKFDVKKIVSDELEAVAEETPKVVEAAKGLGAAPAPKDMPRPVVTGGKKAVATV